LEGKGSFFILLVIVAILALTLAVLAGYLFFIAETPQTRPGITANVSDAARRPADSELASRNLFLEDQVFNLKSEDNKMSVIQVNVELIYFKKPKGIRNVEEKFDLCEGKMREIVGTYFQNMTIDDAKNPETKAKAANELKTALNQLLTSNERQADEVIYEIVFDKWFYQ